MSEHRKHPVGGFAPGMYIGRCGTCRRHFMGDKRSTQCEPCGTKAQEDRVRKRVAWVSEMMAEYGPPNDLDRPPEIG